MKFKYAEAEFSQARILSRKAFEEHGLKIVAEIPTSDILKQAGFNIAPLCQFFFFRPDFMNKIIEASGKDIMRAPLKLIVSQNDDGCIEGACQRPAQIFQGLHEYDAWIFDMETRLENAILGLARVDFAP